MSFNQTAANNGSVLTATGKGFSHFKNHSSKTRLVSKSFKAATSNNLQTLKKQAFETLLQPGLIKHLEKQNLKCHKNHEILDDDEFLELPELESDNCSDQLSDASDIDELKRFEENPKYLAEIQEVNLMNDDLMEYHPELNYLFEENLTMQHLNSIRDDEDVLYILGKSIQDEFVRYQQQSQSSFEASQNMVEEDDINTKASVNNTEDEMTLQSADRNGSERSEEQKLKDKEDELILMKLLDEALEEEDLFQEVHPSLKTTECFIANENDLDQDYESDVSEEL